MAAPTQDNHRLALGPSFWMEGNLLPDRLQKGVELTANAAITVPGNAQPASFIQVW